ncbi:MAG: S8 family serine peptidase [Kineosporiaceae bacterium]
MSWLRVFGAMATAGCLVTVGAAGGAAAAPSAASRAPVHAGDGAASGVVLTLADGADVRRVCDEVRAAGGHVVRVFGGVRQIVATVPGGTTLASRLPGVSAASPQTSVRLFPQSLGTDSAGLPGAMSTVVDAIGARDLWKQGVTGKGVDVALIDTGIAPVPALSGDDKVYLGPDLSVESQEPNLRYGDTMGHGTHMAGIIAGREGGAKAGADYAADTENFYGVAPDARIVSLKVGDVNGAVDVSQVIAAIDWVIQFGRNNARGLNVKVINLSYGTPGVQEPKNDPLSYAVESATRAGITVVVSGGNDGATRDGLNNPAYQPDIIAVGATDTNGTASLDDDTIAKFSAGGGGEGPRRRAPDVVAPGTSIVSLRAPGSSVALANKKAAVGDWGLKGSGTSQAAAVVSGAAALLISQRPWMSPGWVKSLLTKTARPLPGITPLRQGSGVIDVFAASQTWGQEAPLLGGNGTGSIESARGGTWLMIGDKKLYGELDLLGGHWEGGRIGPATSSSSMWDDKGNFNRTGWSGGNWLSPSTSVEGDPWWSSRTWASRTWASRTWAGDSWVSRTWADISWSGATWTEDGWADADWKTTTLTTPMAGDTWSTSKWR